MRLAFKDEHELEKFVFEHLDEYFSEDRIFIPSKKGMIIVRLLYKAFFRIKRNSPILKKL